MRNILEKFLGFIKANAAVFAVVLCVAAVIIGAALTVDVWGDWLALIVVATAFVAYKIYTNQPPIQDTNALRAQFQNQIFDNLTGTFARALRAFEDANKTAKIPTLRDVSNVSFVWNNNNASFAVFKVQKRFLTNDEKVSPDFISQMNSILALYATEKPLTFVNTVYGVYALKYAVCDIKDNIDHCSVLVRIGCVTGDGGVENGFYNSDF